jgi:hypothetical protein
MKILIIMVVLFVVLYLFRNKIKKLIIKYRTKNDIENMSEVNNDLIYVPVKGSRTFYFAIQIDEVGNGNASLSIIKPKDLTIK